MSNDKTAESLLAYDNSILETLRHIEDIQVKFSLQNYVAAGAIFVAHFTKPDKIQLNVAASLVFVVGLVFFLAICSNLWRYKLLFNMHTIVRDKWLTRQPDLSKALKADSVIGEYLTGRRRAWNWPVFLINALPALSGVGAVVLHHYRPDLIG